MSIPNSNLVNLAFSSGFRYEHIAKDPNGNELKGHVIIPQTNSPVTVHHGLGYVPYVRAFYEYTIGGKVYAIEALSTNNTYIEVDLDITTTDLTINAFNNNNWDGTDATLFHNLYVYYRIYAEPT